MFARHQCVIFTLLIFCACLFARGDFASASSSTRILTKSGSPVLVTAGNMFGDSEKQTMELVGNVQMTFDGQTLRADRAIMNKKTGQIVAEGNFILASTTAYVEGSRAEISYEDSTGLIYDGFVKSGQVLFQGKVIRKTGPDRYEADKASYTACTTCPAAWSFSGSRIDAEIGAYAYIKSAWFYLAGFRFFWLPYLIVPLKSERQSGVLFPSYEIDTKGFAIGVPIFWAISRSEDLTFTPKFYTERGWKALVNYRYILDEESQGEMNFGGFLKDSYFSNDEYLVSRPGDERSGRWFINHDHLYSLPGGFINRAKINLVSDLRYTRDFPEEVKGLGDPSLENRLSLTKNTETMHSSVEVAYYVNQLKTNPLEGNADAVHRFPEIKQSGADRSVFDSRLFFRWDFNYVNFTREDFAFDDVILNSLGSSANLLGATPKSIDRARGINGSTGSGTFEPGTDIIRTGQRLDLRPEVSVPFRIGKYFDILPTFQLRHTQYSFNVAAPLGATVETLPIRQYLRARIAMRTQISRVYEDDEPLIVNPDEVRKPASEDDAPSPGIFQALQKPPSVIHPERLKHEIEPEIAISSIPWLHQSESPFFGDNALAPIFVQGQPVSNSDFYSKKGLQFDYEDRITIRNTISALITNRFTKKIWNGDQPTYSQIILIKNGTSYEYDKPNRDGRSLYSDIFTTVDARVGQFDMNSSLQYFPYHGVFNTSARAQLRDENGNFMQLSFSQNYLITENPQEAYASREENIGLGAGLTKKYITILATLNLLPQTYSPIDFRPKSWSAHINLKPPGECWGIRIAVNHVLSEAKPRWNFSFDYLYGGSPGGS